MSKNIDNIIIEEISKILGEITTGSKITNMFKTLNFYDSDSINGEKPVSTKWRRLNETSIHECRKSNSAKPFFKIIEYIMKPQNFMNSSEEWYKNKREVNSHLMFYSYELDDSGKIRSIKVIQNYSEAKRRLQSFEEKLSLHDMHPNTLKFCTEELFQENYFHAILEASKSVLERVRQISDLSSDGAELIQQAFSAKSPIILIEGNMLRSKTDRSLYNGLKNLLETIISLYRNPTAHAPKLYDQTSETDAITAFTLISLAHRILDNCINVRNLD